MASEKKDILRLLKGGTLRPSLYEVLTCTSKRFLELSFNFKFLAIVTVFNNDMVNFNLIAIEDKKLSYEGSTNLWRRYDVISRLVLVDVRDLPLYLGWKYLSGDFTRILKGGVIPCSRYLHRVRSRRLV